MVSIQIILLSVQNDCTKIYPPAQIHIFYRPKIRATIERLRLRLQICLNFGLIVCFIETQVQK